MKKCLTIPMESVLAHAAARRSAATLRSIETCNQPVAIAFCEEYGILRSYVEISPVSARRIEMEQVNKQYRAVTFMLKMPHSC